MQKQDLDPLDRQILRCIPPGEAATLRYIVDQVRTEKTPHGVRYRVERLVRRGYLEEIRVLNSVGYCRRAKADNGHQEATAE